LEIELIVRLLSESPPGVVAIQIDIVVDENVHEICRQTVVTFSREAFFCLDSANHSGDKILHIAFVIFSFILEPL
jgi:hypothetical protein